MSSDELQEAVAQEIAISDYALRPKSQASWDQMNRTLQHQYLRNAKVAIAAVLDHLTTLGADICIIDGDKRQYSLSDWIQQMREEGEV